VNQIREMAATHSGRPIEKIGPETRLFHDLAIDGDTAEEFLTEVCRKFSLAHEGFPSPRYFGSEFGAGWRHLFIARLGLFPKRLAPLTVSEVAEWAHNGTFSAHENRKIGNRAPGNMGHTELLFSRARCSSRRPGERKVNACGPLRRVIVRPAESQARSSWRGAVNHT